MIEVLETSARATCDGTMGRTRGTGKAAIAAEAWAAVLDLAFGQRKRFLIILQEFGLIPGDLRALFALDHDTPRPMRTLAATWACDASNVAWMVDRLETRGLVERRTLPSDRRVKTVVLTPLGARTKAELLTRLHEPPPDFAALDRDTLEALRDALTKLPPSLRTAGPHPPATTAAPHDPLHRPTTVPAGPDRLPCPRRVSRPPLPREAP
jgi:MarR family transcriptional regulator, organic hydroperoxide resistance regulator